MAQLTDSFDLSTLRLAAGEGHRADLVVPVDSLRFGGQDYAASGGRVGARLDVSRTTGSGYVLRLRFAARLEGPCMRCLERASVTIQVDAREADQPGVSDENLSSPYVDAHELDVRAWVREALVLALPAQIVCQEECLGLCAACGARLNDDPTHGHEPVRDPRWAKLSELKLD